MFTTTHLAISIDKGLRSANGGYLCPTEIDMLVFSKHKLVFLSVPKTGTTAWQAALGPHASMVISDPPELKHAPVFRYNRFFRPALEKFIGEDLHVIAVI